MGRGRRKGKRKRKRGGRDDSNAEHPPKRGAGAGAGNKERYGTNATWQRVPPSDTFKEYYHANQIVPEDEWETFLDQLTQPLPCTFRLGGAPGHVETMLGRMKAEIVPEIVEALADAQQRQAEAAAASTVVAMEVEGAETGGGDDDDDDGEAAPVAPEPLPVVPEVVDWFPGERLWEIAMSPGEFKRCPAMRKLRTLMIAETQDGRMSRQEAVSMIPVQFLQPEAHHFVLDMCAAPGSKTTQILEDMTRSTNHAEAGRSQDGFCWANDVKRKRLNALLSRTKAVGNPHLLTSCMPAQALPTIEAAHGGDLERLLALHAGVPVPAPQDRTLRLAFDRILADVPCSGDGTARKSPDLWRHWSPLEGNALHPLQCDIAFRALRLLAPGGRLVYSTCSFNPVENEAVVAHTLRRCKGTVRVVDVSAMLPHLARRPGITSWVVHGRPRDNREAPARPCPLEEAEACGLRPSAYPPTAPADAWIRDELRKCVRIVPHDQNTGGFFVCVLEHVAAPVADAEGAEDADADVVADVVADVETEAAAETETETETEAETEAAGEKKRFANALGTLSGSLPAGVSEKQYRSRVLTLPMDADSRILSDNDGLLGLSDDLVGQLLVRKMQGAAVLGAKGKMLVAGPTIRALMCERSFVTRVAVESVGMQLLSIRNEKGTSTPQFVQDGAAWAGANLVSRGSDARVLNVHSPADLFALVEGTFDPRVADPENKLTPTQIATLKGAPMQVARTQLSADVRAQLKDTPYGSILIRLQLPEAVQRVIAVEWLSAWNSHFSVALRVSKALHKVLLRRITAFVDAPAPLATTATAQPTTATTTTTTPATTPATPQ